MLASAYEDGNIQFWDPATRRPLSPPFPGKIGVAVSQVAFSPDGTVLASVGDGLRLWAVATHRLIRHVPSATAMTTVAFSPDGKMLATDSTSGFQLWNPATGAPAGKPLQPMLAGTNGPARAAFSPRTSLLATATASGLVQLWNPSGGAAIGWPRVQGSEGFVQYSPKADLLMGDADGFVAPGRAGAGSTRGPSAVYLWTGDPLTAISPDGRLVAIATSDPTAPSEIRLLDTSTLAPAGAPLIPPYFVTSLAFSPDGAMLATADLDGYARLWNVATGKPASRPLAAGDRALGASDAVFSPDGKLLATASNAGYVRLWNAATGAPAGTPIRTYSGRPAAARAVAFSADGTVLATANIDGAVDLWNVGTHRLMGVLPAPQPPQLGPSQQQADPGSGAVAVAFSPDGGLLATGYDSGQIQLWELPAQKAIGAPVSDDVNGLSALTFSPDGSLLLVGSSFLGMPAEVEPFLTWMLANPYAALCADVGSLSKADWPKWAGSEPQPNTCADAPTP
jgi:WD40 repeat protein